MLNRTIAPPIIDPVAFNISLPSCKTYTLSNGVEVFTVDMGSEDTLMINWVFYAGNTYEKNKVVAAATNYLLKNGTSKRNAFDINEHFEYYGALLSRTCYSETAEISLHTLSRYANKLLPVVSEIMTDSVFPQEELDIFIQNSQQRLKVNLHKSEFVAGRLIEASIFGENHPYGKYHNLEDYAALKREDLVSFYDRYYKQGHCLLFAAGKLPADLLESLEKNFGQLPLQSHKKLMEQPVHALQPAAQKKSSVINDVDGVQAAIRIGRPFPNRHHPDFQKVLVLNNIYGGFFGARLMTNIREDKGYTYSIYSYLLNYIHESGWIIATEAGRTVADDTIREIYAEMKLLCDEPVDDEELQMTRNYMIGMILGDLDGPFQVIARWKNMILNNVDENYFYQGLHIIRTTTAAELHELANKYLNPDDFYEVTVI